MGVCISRPPAPDPGPRPQFLFDGPRLNLYLAFLAFKLYLPALAS